MGLATAYGFVRLWILAALPKRSKRVNQASSFVSQATTCIRTVATLTMEPTIIQKYRTMLVSEAWSHRPRMLSRNRWCLWLQALGSGMAGG
jgi:hypothetical protein